MYGNELIDPIAPFQDPYSEVSLFLARKIKQLANPKDQWSHHLQEELIQKITPEFVKKFPSHRLGGVAIKKTWEKVAHLAQLFREQNDALTSTGKINLHFLIRENLKTILSQSKNSSFHPFLLSQQLALKIGESIATFEGVRPELEQLTEIIWTALHHLVPPTVLSYHPGFKKKTDARDRLITKCMIDVLTNEPAIPFHDLQKALQNRLKLFQTIKDDITPYVNELSMQWASLLLPHTTLFQTKNSGVIRSLKNWIHSQIHEINWDDTVQDIKTAALAARQKVSLYDLEILAWECFREKHTPMPPSPLYNLLLEEAKSYLIHHPEAHWRKAIAHAESFLKKAHLISNMGTTAHMYHRIEHWSLQGELALRTIPLPESPLLHFVYAMHAKNRSLKDPTLTQKLREQYLYRYRSPLIEPAAVHRAADLIRKYGWYQIASTPHDVTIDRFFMLHEQANAQDQFPILPLDVRKNRYRPIKMNGTESH